MHLKSLILHLDLIPIFFYVDIRPFSLIVLPLTSEITIPNDTCGNRTGIAFVTHCRTMTISG